MNSQMNGEKGPTTSPSPGLMNSIPRGTVYTKDLLVAKAEPQDPFISCVTLGKASILHLIDVN